MIFRKNCSLSLYNDFQSNLYFWSKNLKEILGKDIIKAVQYGRKEDIDNFSTYLFDDLLKYSEDIKECDLFIINDENFKDELYEEFKDKCILFIVNTNKKINNAKFKFETDTFKVYSEKINFNLFDVLVCRSVFEKYLKLADVTIDLCTKNRYPWMLSCLHSILLQNKLPEKIIISDMSDNPINLIQDQTIYGEQFKQFISLCNFYGVEWLIKTYDRGDLVKGNIIAHQFALDKAKTEFIFRVDDDTSLQSECVYRLLNEIESNLDLVGVAPVVSQWGVLLNTEYKSSSMEYFTPLMQNLQWCVLDKNEEVERFYSTYLYRKSSIEKVKYRVELNLSQKCHNEETVHSYELYKNCGKLMIVKDAIVHHFKTRIGGIRSGNNDKSFWDNDDKITKDFLKEKYGASIKNIAVIPVTSALGDNYVFKQVFMDFDLDKYDEFHIFTNFPDHYSDIKSDKIKIYKAKDCPIFGAFGPNSPFNPYVIGGVKNLPIIDCFREIFKDYLKNNGDKK